MEENRIGESAALPANLEALHEQVEGIRAASKLTIKGTAEAREQLDIVYASLNMLFDITNSYDYVNDDELTIQFLGLRLFNTVTSALELLLAGYYQSSVILQRDLLETGYLIDYFRSNKSKISRWKAASAKERQRKFQPSAIRKALDVRDGEAGRNREQIYQTVCEYAVHPPYAGNQLVSPDGLGLIGPFFDERYMGALLKEMAMRVPSFTEAYLDHFDALPSEFNEVRSDFLAKLDVWQKGPGRSVGGEPAGLSELLKQF